MRQPLKLAKRLEIRKNENSFRALQNPAGMIDFSSNDYLGFSGNPHIYDAALGLMQSKGITGRNGASGSRLLTGNHKLYEITENYIKRFHDAGSALIFNSGYDANIGFFSSVPQRGDIILYDELVHASIREGIRLSNAIAFKFRHNGIKDLEDLLIRYDSMKENETKNLYIVSESVFSMDGDVAPLEELAGLADAYNAFLIVDEAHATGVFGKNGEGLVQYLNLQHRVFARVITFGKALGVHGAAIVGDKILTEYLINFCRSFIYTTALPPHSVAAILASYMFLDQERTCRDLASLKNNIEIFKSQLELRQISTKFIESESPIQCCVIPGNDEVKQAALSLQAKGFDVRPILSPTVAPGLERLRICLHAFNTPKDIAGLVEQLAIFIK